MMKLSLPRHRQNCMLSSEVYKFVNPGWLMAGRKAQK
jgi:hypothetical protein